MAKPSERTSESDDLFDSWDEEEDYTDDEGQDGGDDEEFDYDSLSPAEKKRYDKLRKQIEDSVVETLAKGDTDSPIYKGLQRVVSKKDREIEQQRQALAAVIQELNLQKDRTDEVSFLKDIVKDMLDDDSKKAFDERFGKFQNEKKMSQQEQLLRALLQQGQQQTYPAYGNTYEEDPGLQQLRKQATEKLKSFAKRMGADPEKDPVDLGDESEPLVVRMDKLQASIERILAEKDEREVDSVRRRGPQPNTRTRNSPKIPGESSLGEDLLSRGTEALLRKMRQV